MMILVDEALRRREAEGTPVRVAMVGAGFMARGIAHQIAVATPGIQLVAIANRRLDVARCAFDSTGYAKPCAIETASAANAAIAAGRPVVTDDPKLLCEADEVDAIVEVTGSINYAADVACHAIRHGKHVILMNAELDGTIGPLLKRRADAAGVIYSNVDGDQPGVTMNLYRFVRGIGVRPVLCGNIKGLHDPTRNPTTQKGFARKWGQKPHMVTSFADGTKVSFEQAVIANATGMQVADKGMIGPTVPAGTPIVEAAEMFPEDLLLNGDGLVDYVVGAEPAPGVFVLGTTDDGEQRGFLDLYKLGKGPIYCFYTPYHLCHFEVPTTIARAALFHDATIAPAGAPRVEVVATAKIDLDGGDVIDGIGHYTTYGQCRNADEARRDELLPMGLAAGCRLRHSVGQSQILTLGDVEIPPGRLIDSLRAEQDALFAEQ